MSLATLKRQAHQLSHPEKQLEILENSISEQQPSFQQQLKKIDLFPLQPTGIDIFQINVGKMCNQVCKHCHVDAGPDRKEIMTRETMEQCLKAIVASGAHTVDLTGGAPEMNPEFRWLVEQLSALNVKIIVRCNLTIILANPKYNDLPSFFAKHRVNVVSSLPYYNARRTDAQRGDGVFEKSIEALKMLNAEGYGLGNPDLQLDLVYNPSGAFLPGDQLALESDFKRKLKRQFEISFDHLFTITNLPVSRFLDYLIASENFEQYQQELIDAFNPMAARGVMCRNTISVSWDGYLYDCDFNQMLEMKMAIDQPHVADFDTEVINERSIRINQHCYGCTAGAGSSCGGALD